MTIEDIVNIINRVMPNYHVTNMENKRTYVRGRENPFDIFSIYTYSKNSLDDENTWYVHVNKIQFHEKYEIKIPESNIEEFFILLDSYLMDSRKILSMINENNCNLTSLIKKEDVYKTNIRDIKINKIL